jgi:hypothetical protein
MYFSSRLEFVYKPLNPVVLLLPRLMISEAKVRLQYKVRSEFKTYAQGKTVNMWSVLTTLLMCLLNGKQIISSYFRIFSPPCHQQ